MTTETALSAAEAQDIAPGRKWLFGLALVATVGLLAAGVALGVPLAFWTWHIHQAGVLMDESVTWPEPHYSDALPQLQNPPLLTTVRGHLKQARRWRPNHFHAHRMEAVTHMAQGNWLDAEVAIEAAVADAVRNPLVQFDRVLIHEQMMDHLAAHPGQGVWQAVQDQQGTLLRPAADRVCAYLDRSTDCDAVNQTVPLPVNGLDPVLVREGRLLAVLSAEPIEIEVSVPQAAPWLVFLAGVHPESSPPPPAGVRLTIAVQGEGQADWVQVSEVVLPPDSQATGWIPTQADLGRWAGTVVRLRLGAAPFGPAVGWADLSFQSAASAAFAMRTPEQRWQQSLLAGGFRSSDLQALAQEAENRGQTDRSAAWQRRADVVAAHEPPPASP